MHIMYFTERPYPYVPEEELIRNGGAWGLPNTLFDPVKDYEARQRNLQLIVGTPKTVLPKIRKILETLRPGIFGIWHHEAALTMTHQDTMRSLRLLGEEVLPAMREMGKELGLVDPYQRKPGSRPLPPSGVWEPVVGAMALAS